jgi:23S rRNA pseudouridine2605 synthase
MIDEVLPDPDQNEPESRETDRSEQGGPSDDSLAAEGALKAAASDTFEQAADGMTEAGEEVEREDEPAPKLERIQKILAQAGIASRRHAEELIIQGRVQVNGKVVTELGSKADPARDHIRVDGKLLQGSERLRYYMLNKPKGFVTTVSDPEGRPTIMEFFSKMRERLYPVGRLDYLSEGLLLVTNDGELAHKLTRAASGVEKTYLVKVSGQPTEEDLDRLREGVGISRGKPGSGRVQTAPAQIRMFRPGRGANPRSGSRGADNPWYEVVLIEGRNRELRKMFEEIGHHVEKIRRIGYGPLELDLEPGKVRELEPEEVENLRKAAEGKYRKPKAREGRKHDARPDSRRGEFRRPGAKPEWKQRGEARGERSNYRRPERPERSERRGESGGARRPERGDFRGGPRGGFQSKPRFEETRGQRPPRREPSESPGARPERFQRSERRPSGSFRSRPEQEPRTQRFGERGPASERSRPASRFGNAQRPRFDRNRGQSPERPPRFDRNREQPSMERPRSDRNRGQSSERPPRFDRNREQPSLERPPRFDRDREQPSLERPRFDRKRERSPERPPRFDRNREQPSMERPRFDRKREQSSERPPRFDRDREQPPKRRLRIEPANEQPSEQRPDFKRDRDRERQSRPERRRPEDSGARPQGRRVSERSSSGARPNRFNRPGTGSRGKGPGPKGGSVRSGGGRRPGSRPGGKPGKPPGGKRRG